MLRREMTVASGHRNRFMARKFLNLFDRCTCHSKPRTKSVPVAVPDVALNLGILQARDKPRACVEARALPNEDRIGGLVQFVFKGPQCCDGVGVEMNSASGTIFRLRQINGATVKMNLSQVREYCSDRRMPVLTEMMNSARCSGKRRSMTL